MKKYEIHNEALYRAQAYELLEDAEREVKAAVEAAKSKLEAVMREFELRCSHALCRVDANPSVASTENFILDEKAFLDDKASDIAGAMFKAIEGRVG